MKEPFIKPLAILTELKSHGHEAYFVGGAVRDLLLNREIGDIDIATSARPEQVKSLFSKTIDVGAIHGTIIVLLNGSAYEVTTYRSEDQYEDYRRPGSVTFIKSLKEDLARRDFTMNAIAMSSEGKIVDPFHGRKAIAAKLIQTVGDPTDRFSEDALRMMRAIRFVSQLSFRLDENTYKAIKVNTKLLENISVERKTVEFEKLISGENYETSLKYLEATEIFWYLPGMGVHNDRISNLQSFDWTSLTERPEHWTLLVYLLQCKHPAIFLRSWKLPNKVIKNVMTNLHLLNQVHSMDDWSRILLYTYGEVNVIQAEKVRSVLMDENINENLERLHMLFKRMPITSRRELAIDGHDLIMIYNEKPGAWVADLLEKVEQEVIMDRIKNDKGKIEEWLLTCNLK